MKSILFLVMFFPVLAFCDEGNFFFSIKNGYKVRETTNYKIGDTYDKNVETGHDWRTTFSIGYQKEKCIHQSIVCSFGYSHESSPLSGAPLNDDYEYWVDQIYFEIKVLF